MNLELEVREILVMTCSLPGVEYVFCTTPIPVKDNELEDREFFFRQIESKYDIVITYAERKNLNTVGEVIKYLKLRLKAVAQ